MTEKRASKFEIQDNVEIQDKEKNFVSGGDLYL
jgi:hypothetical protein